MDEYGIEPGGAIHESNGCLVVPVDGALDEEGLKYLGTEILHRLETSQVRGVIINVSGVVLLNVCGFTVLKNAARAAGMMGYPAIFAGFRAGVVSALVDLDADFNGISATVTMGEAFDRLKRRG